MTARDLVEWYRKNARILPWRGAARDPYHVVVSEFMLQQTQVDRVVPRFESFIRRYPTIAALAAAGEDEVVEEWSGLGYYRRARMLHRLAVVVAHRDGQLPTSSDELKQLPGVGPYTAAAVASLAWGEAVPVLDGNTMRVGARMLGLEADPRSAVGSAALAEWIVGLMEEAPPGEVNEALMELGATVCAPVQPACDQCPIGASCEARLLRRQEDFPAPRRRRDTVSLRWAAACIVDADERWLVRKIDDGPILRGLWLPPLADVAEGDEPVEAARRLVRDPIGPPIPGPVVRHHITHRKIDVFPVRFDVDRFDPASDRWVWVEPRNPGVPTSSLLQKLVDALYR